jgi:hypothetical protein
MIATDGIVQQFAERLEECRRRQHDLWDAFARDYDKKAVVVSFLVGLAFSLSEDQVAQMERSQGIAAASLTTEQKALLANAEPGMRELHFLDHTGGKRLKESTVEFLAGGHTQFRWGTDGDRYGLGINWLPYSQCGPQRDEPFAEALSRWRDRREWLIRQHYADFRQAADCCRLLFRLALSLSPEQVPEILEPPGLPVPALRPEQRLLLTAAAGLYPYQLPADLDEYSVQFEPQGQFWLRHGAGTRTSRYGMGWLPSSYKE